MIYICACKNTLKCARIANVQCSPAQREHLGQQQGERGETWDWEIPERAQCTEG